MAELAWKLNSLFHAEESTFNTDPSSSGAGFTFLRAINAQFTPTIEFIEREGQRDDFVRQPHVMGSKGGTLEFDLELKGHGTQAGAGVAAAAPEADLILKHLLGTATRGTGSTVVSATTTTITVTGGHGVQFAKGMAIEVATTPAQRRHVKSISGDVLTIEGGAFSPTPTVGQIVYASSLYKPANTAHKSLAFVGRRDTVIYTFTGCIGKFSVPEVAANGVPVIHCTFEAATWVRGGKGSLPATTSATVWPQPPVVRGSPSFLDTAAFPIAGFSFDPGMDFQHTITTAPDDTKAGFIMADRNPAGTVKPLYVSTHEDKFHNGTEAAWQVLVGGRSTGAGSQVGFGIYCPKIQFTGAAMQERNGHVGLEMPFKVNDNGADAHFYLSVF